MSCENAADASGRTDSAVRQCGAIVLLVRRSRPSICSTCSNLLEFGLERLRGQRAVVVRRSGATGRAFVFRSRAVRLLLLTDPLMLLRGGRMRLGLDRFLPRRLLSRCGGCCNKDQFWPSNTLFLFKEYLQRHLKLNLINSQSGDKYILSSSRFTKPNFLIFIHL